MALMEHKVQMVLMELKVRLELMVLMDLKVQLEHKALKGIKA
jgi:hypothetical protein